MAIEWTHDLATGIDWQDKEHKELFVRINSLKRQQRNILIIISTGTKV